MSLRARLLAAFAYTLIVVIVALEVPLSAQRQRPGERGGRGGLRRAGPGRRGIGRRPAPDAGAAWSRSRPRRPTSLNGLVFVIDGAGQRDCELGPAAVTRATPADRRPGRPAGARRERSLRAATTRAATSSPPPCRSSATAGRSARSRSSRALSAVHSQVRQDVLALIGIGALALVLGLGVAWILAGSIARPLRSLGEAARRRAGGDARPAHPSAARASRSGGTGIQRDGGPARGRARVPAGVRRGRLASAPHAAHGAAPAPRGGGREDRRPGGRKELTAAERESRAARASWSRTCWSSPRASSPPRTSRADLDVAARDAAERWRGPRARAGTRSRSRATARCGAGGLARARRDPRQPGRERDQVLAARLDRDDRDASRGRGSAASA